MDFVTESSRRIPVIQEVDVMVAGGGITGTIAAIAAARQGARTIVVDRFGSLGGNMGPGMFVGGTFHLAICSVSGPENDDALVNKEGMGGVPEELLKRVIYARPDSNLLTDRQKADIERLHCNVSGLRVGTDYIIDSHTFSYVALQMMREAGAEVLLSTYVCDPVMQDGAVRGAIVENKSGRQAIKAKVVVDATGDADVAVRAAAPVIDYQPVPGIGLFYAFGDVEYYKYQMFLQEHKTPSDDDLQWLQRTVNTEIEDEEGRSTLPQFYHLLPFIREAWEGGEFKFIKDIGIGSIITRPFWPMPHNLVGGRAEASGKLSPGNADQISMLECELRNYVFELAGFLRKYVPGFERCYAHIISSYLGARGGRSIDSEYVVTKEDVAAGRRFDDVIYVYSDERTLVPGGCDIPYRALVPKRVDGLLAVGRSAVLRSPNFRQRYSAALMAQAGGIAAALCAKESIQPRNLNATPLQRILFELGCPLGDKDRLADLGLIRS